LKLAVSGKGGVGKTTFTALLSKALVARGYSVFAIDSDPNPTLLGSMGYPDPESVRPLVELKDLIEERTGARPGSMGGMVRLNPFVDDIPAKYAVDIGGVKVLVAGAVKRGGAGCYCPENTLVRALISHLLVDRSSALILDMEAGIEHLSRGTVASVDFLMVVVEPSHRSVETAFRIRQMATELGLKRVLAVGNKVRSQHDREFLEKSLVGWEMAGVIPYDETIRESETGELGALRAAPGTEASVDQIASLLVDKTAALRREGDQA